MLFASPPPQRPSQQSNINIQYMKKSLTTIRTAIFAVVAAAMLTVHAESPEPQAEQTEATSANTPAAPSETPESGYLRPSQVSPTTPQAETPQPRYRTSSGGNALSREAKEAKAKGKSAAEKKAATTGTEGQADTPVKSAPKSVELTAEEKKRQEDEIAFRYLAKQTARETASKQLQKVGFLFGSAEDRKGAGILAIRNVEAEEELIELMEIEDEGKALLKKTFHLVKLELREASEKEKDAVIAEMFALMRGEEGDEAPSNQTEEAAIEAFLKANRERIFSPIDDRRGAKIPTSRLQVIQGELHKRHAASKDEKERAILVCADLLCRQILAAIAEREVQAKRFAEARNKPVSRLDRGGRTNDFFEQGVKNDWQKKAQQFEHEITQTLARLKELEKQ